MKRTLYTFGYLHGRAERIFQELIAMRIPCVDIRYSPTSNRAAYLGETICQRSGIIYESIKELGNKRYIENLSGKFQEAVVEIANLEAGLDQLKIILDMYGKAAIFCACSNHELCHRDLVAQEARDLFGVEVVHLPVKKARITRWTQESHQNKIARAITRAHIGDGSLLYGSSAVNLDICSKVLHKTFQSMK